LSMGKGREGMKERRGGKEEGEGWKGRVAPLSEILNTPLVTGCEFNITR